MRQVDRMIFFGNHECLAKCYKLHQRLEEAFTILGGLQQPDHSSSEHMANINKREGKKLKRELIDIAADISVALLGDECAPSHCECGEELVHVCPICDRE